MVREMQVGGQLYMENSCAEPGPTQMLVPPASFGIWHEEVFQLGIDFMTLITRGIRWIRIRCAWQKSTGG